MNTFINGRERKKHQNVYLICESRADTILVDPNNFPVEIYRQIDVFAFLTQSPNLW